jgi:hypothetical protein
MCIDGISQNLFVTQYSTIIKNLIIIEANDYNFKYYRLIQPYELILPVRCRVRIGPKHPLAYLQEATKWGGPSNETGKTEPRVTAGLAR